MAEAEKEIKETTKAYLAGHIDASSSVGIYKIKGLEIPMVRIRRREPRMLEFIKKTWGGTLTNTAKAKELTLTHRQAWTFLVAVKPWLLIKREMADQIIKHYETFIKEKEDAKKQSNG